MSSFLHSGPSGYFNAPISKVVLSIVLAINVFGAILGSRHGGARVLGYNAVPLRSLLLNPLQWWRFATGPYVFSSLGELFFGIILLYVFRVFERLWGSQKYFIFATFTCMVSFLVQVGLVALLLPTKVVWSGPYALIYASLVQYIIDIPPMSKFEVFRFQFNEKYIVLLIAIQLMLTNLPFSLVAALAGISSGLLYRIEFLRLNQLHLLLPRFAVQLATKYIYPFVNPAPTTIRRRRRQQQQQQQQDVQQIQQLLGDEQSQTRQRNVQAQGYADNLLGGNNNNANATAFWNALLQYQQQVQQQNLQQPQQQQQQQQQFGDEEPSEDNITMLTEMGYSREEAANALRLSNNNLQQAVDILVGER